MDNYKEYFVNRRPTSFGASIIRFWHKRLLKVVSRRVPQFFNQSILEIGAGHGFFADCCKQMKIDYEGYEMNTAQALTLQRQGIAITHAKIPPIPEGNDKQIIWLSHVLEHAVNYDEARAMLIACHSRLQENGYLIIIAPDILHWRMYFWSWDWSHGFPTSLNRVKQLLNETGFSVDTALHHTATLTNPIIAWFISSIFYLFPVELLDFFCEKITGRYFFQAFMSVYGYRQILLIGQKQQSGA